MPGFKSQLCSDFDLGGLFKISDLGFLTVKGGTTLTPQFLNTWQCRSRWPVRSVFSTGSSPITCVEGESDFTKPCHCILSLSWL